MENKLQLAKSIPVEQDNQKPNFEELLRELVAAREELLKTMKIDASEPATRAIHRHNAAWAAAQAALAKK